MFEELDVEEPVEDREEGDGVVEEEKEFGFDKPPPRSLPTPEAVVPDDEPPPPMLVEFAATDAAASSGFKVLYLTLSRC